VLASVIAAGWSCPAGVMSHESAVARSVRIRRDQDASSAHRSGVLARWPIHRTVHSGNAVHPVRIPAMTDHSEGCQILQSGICTCRTPVLVLNTPSYLLTDTMRLAMEAAWYAGNRAPRGERNPYTKPNCIECGEPAPCMNHAHPTHWESTDAERYNQRGCYTERDNA
jgi:hypothetical protein